MSFALTPAAVQHRDILEAVQQLEPGASIDGLAKSLGRDPSNFRKTLKLLEKDDLIRRETDPRLGPVKLTPAGLAALQAMGLADAPAVAPTGAFTHAQIRPNPNNPRKRFDPDALGELAESIARHGLKQGLLLRPDPDGHGAELTAGERRWRAIGMLITAQDPRWPADRPIPCMMDETTGEDQILAVALIENLQRRDLPEIDEAAAFASLKAMGWSAVRIAEEVGVNRRTVELRLDLLNLPESDQARMRLSRDDANHLGWNAALELLRHRRRQAQEVAETGAQLDLESLTAQALDGVTAKLALIMVELADKAEREPTRTPGWSSAGGYTYLPQLPAGGAASTLQARGLIDLKPSQARIGAGFGRVNLDAAGVRDWLAAANFFEDRRGALWKARVDVFGADKASALTRDGRYASDWLNEPDPLIVDGVRYPNQTLANEARRILTGERPANHGAGAARAAPPGPVAPPDPEAPEPLHRRGRVILVELADKILAASDAGPATAVPVGAYWLDASVNHLVQERKFIRFHNPGDGWRAQLTPDGWGYLDAEGLMAAGYLRGGVLDELRGHVGQPDWAGPGYVTAWLNVAPPSEAATAEAAVAPQAPAPEPHPEDGTAAEVLAKVRAGIATGLCGPGRDLAFRQLLEFAGLFGPFKALEGEGEIGVVSDANGSEAATADTLGELSDPLALARAELIAFALTAASGHSTLWKGGV